MRIITTKLFVVFAFTSFVTFAQNNTTNQGVNSGELGNNNSFFGGNSGRDNTANNNSFFGANSGQSNTTGQTNVFVGRNSGRNNVEGSNNVFNGNSAGFSNASGNFNTFLGTFAGRENIDGRRNVFVGGNAGRNSTGNANILIGYRAGFNETGNNKLIIENSDSDTPLVYGDFATDQFGINTNTIPDGYNFAVGGGASIDGSVKAATLDIEAPDNSEDWLPVTIGREVKPFTRNFNFVVSPSTSTNELLGFSIVDKNLISRQDNYFRDDFTRISYMSNRNQYIFSLDHNDRQGQDQAAIQMPLTNSKIVIAGFGDYLEDQGHKFIVKDGTALIENAIYTNGRIAIGTTEDDPGYALTVKGKVHVQEVKVDLLGVLAPDYVFYEDYKLKTLEQVEDYIDQEGHLPNIPSASEMESQGVNLKEMNMRLLEKVEELTLYTIAQEKAIKEQQEANDALEKRLQKLEKLLQQ
ncbi:tail fiber protein [uncultured Aquimarina sp.]|uniref:tail fiber protein n=1 Tax=uncultured Aquimarina sp. TaxID=575652 RepID=UPI00260B66C7|nr:tail fiber protein [uncultured Aquimarina sp.]